MNVAGGAASRGRPPTLDEATPERPRFVAGAIGPMNRTLSISPDVNDPAAFARSPSTRSATPTPSRSRPHRRRRRPPPRRDHLRHAQRQGRPRRDRRGLRERAASACRHDLRHHHRQERPHALGPDDRGVLDERRARPRSASASTARSAPRDAPLPRGARRIADTCRISCYPNAGLPNAFGGTTRPPPTTGGSSPSSPSGLVNLVGGCCGTTPDHIRAIAAAVEGLRPRRSPRDADPLRAFFGLEPLTIRPTRTSS
jgi:5-methyltetrahydrofolate--homocysteine methyltransferase